MEFLGTPLPVAPPKFLSPCLASITISPASAGAGNIVGSNDRRRLSASSGQSGGHLAPGGGGEEDESVLKRVISGGRRKSSFGAQDGERRKSIAPSLAHAQGHFGAGGNAAGQAASGPEGVEKGTWFWRVQAGVTDDALVLLPLTQPANPLLTAPPQPLSAAMPSHNKDAHGSHGHGHGHGHGHDDEGLVDKVKNLFRRSSTTNPDAPATAHSHPQGGDGGAKTKDGDKVVDQTPAGDQLPASGVAAAGGGNLNEHAEAGWPGVVQGQKLQAVVVQLNQVERGKVGISGGKRGEASWVTVPINSHFASMIQGFGDGGQVAKSGTIKLEFDKDWIGSKGEAELLHHKITSALSNRSPKPPQVQLGNAGAGVGAAPVAAASGAGAGAGTAAGGAFSQPNFAGAPTSTGAPRVDDVAPDAGAPAGTGVGAGLGAGSVELNESVASGRKVPGEA